MNTKDKAALFRRRFFGRQDVFGRKWETTRDDGTKFSGYMPVCSQLWAPNCHLRLKDGRRCDTCEIKKYEPVSDESVLRHIRGEESQIMYVLQQDGTIKFGAIDVDLKPGREEKGYRFEDVSRILKLLRDWGVPYGVARSTGSGYHVYFFFSEFVAANKFRAFIYEIYERCSFMELLRQGLKPLPEVFPKQSYNAPDGIGNGLKPPLIEPQFEKGRNCWVTDNDEVIPAEVQWEYFSKIGEIGAAQLDQLIAEHHIEVHEDGPASNGPARSHMTGLGKRTGRWQPPLAGSIEKVLEGCTAMRKVRDKALKGEVLSHDEGFSLYHLCMTTSDGLGWFKKNVVGWGTNETELKQLEHSLKKNYSPWTCRKLQEHSLCLPKTKCFNKKPPIELVEGQIVYRTDVPESEWPEPSPIRYAFGKGEDFLSKLQREADEAKTIEDGAERSAKLKDIIYRAQVFDEEQQKELKAYLKANKIAKAVEISRMFNEAEQKSTEDLKASASERDDTMDVHGNYYQKLQPHGYAVLKLIRNKNKITQLCSNDISIEEERSYIDDEAVVQTVYRGKAVATGIEKSFEVDAAKWLDNNEFQKFFGVLLGNSYNVLKANVDFIRQASMGFSARAGLQKTTYLCTQGWHGKAYLTPSVVVDAAGVRPNTEQQVDLSRKERARHLDFQILEEDDFRDVLMHIKTDLLNTWPREWTTVALSHALYPAIMGPLKIVEKPVLFYEGLTGSGKTKLTHATQYFYGQFSEILNLESSQKGIMDVAHDFKDALLVVDDYKSMGRNQVEACAKAIQYSYDGSASLKLNRDSTQRKAKGSRSIMVFSGEHFVSNDASVAARCVLLEVDKHDTSNTRESYDRVWESVSKYSGVTPRFIHFFLQTDIKDHRARMGKIRLSIYDQVFGRQNADRVATNLAINHFTWQLFVDFMKHHDIVSHQEADELVKEHWGYTCKIARSMIDRCEEEQNGVVFVRVLRQLITSHAVSIENLDGFQIDKRPVIGFVPDKDGEPNTIYVYPDVVFREVKGYSKDIPIAGTDRAIGRQLLEMKVLKEVDKGRLKKQVRYKDTRSWVWALDMEALGFKTQLKVVGSTEPLLANQPPLQKDAEGIY